MRICVTGAKRRPVVQRSSSGQAYGFHSPLVAPWTPSVPCSSSKTHTYNGLFYPPSLRTTAFEVTLLGRGLVR